MLLLLTILLAPASQDTIADGVRRLSNADAAQRWYAAQALAQSGPKAVAALGMLAKLLADKEENEYVRGAAARAIGAIGPQAASAAPLLGEVSASAGHLSVRRHATWALGRLGSASRGQLAAIVARLDDPDPTVRANAAVALWQVERNPRAMVVLRTMAQSPDPATALRTVWALEELATELQGATPLLAALAEHTDADVARTALAAMAKAGTEGRLATQRLFASKDSAIRIRAANALAHSGAAALPALAAALRDPSAPLRRSAVRSIGRLGRSPAARQTLLGALRDPDPGVRQAAAEALHKGPGGDPEDGETRGHQSPAR